MTEKIIFTDTQIDSYSKRLDGLVDWTKVLGKKKVILFFTIDFGKVAENNDRKVWKKLFLLLNKKYQDGKIKEELAELIRNVFSAIEEKDESELTDIISKTISGKINFLDDDTKEEKLIKSGLAMFSALDEDFLDDLSSIFEKLELKADKQDS